MSFKYEETLCPDCNGEMVSRTGKFGVFWGCKKFPICKGTRDSQGRSKADRDNEKRTCGRDKQDKEILEGLAEEIDKHDLREGQKTSWNKK